MHKTLQIYRNGQPHLVVNIDEETFFSQVVMGEHVISSTFLSEEPMDIDEGDYIMLGGEKFSINKTLPPVTRSAKNELSYGLQLQGYIYDLHYCAFRHLGSAEFELFATADVFMNILVECLNRIYSGWTVGTVDATEPKLIQFFENGKGFSCKGALIKFAEAFGLEFWLTGKTINLTAQAGVDTNITFEYGRGRGLYEIVRGEIDNNLYFNRLYVEGSTQNIPVGYRGGMKRLQIDVPYLQLEVPAGKRIRETQVVVDDIFPKRIGTIAAVSADQLQITDSSIDLDLNGQRIEGQKSTIEMLTGENSGQSFEIDRYVHATKTITIVENKETTGEVRPNTVFQIKPGDQYFFAGIKMPDTYVAAAEAELKAKGVELLQKASSYVPPYTVRVSDKFMRDNGLKINAGDRVRLKDAALGIDVKIRVSAVKFLLVDPYSVELQISDIIPYTPEDKAIIEVEKNKKETVVVNKVNAEKARRNMLDIRRLQQNVFDPDGYFDPQNIKPNSIETLMLSVGAKSQNYGLNGVSINANTGGDANYVTVSQGLLVHYEIQIEGLGYVWQMGAAEFPGLDPEKTYFLSAKCRTTALTGEWVLSETPIKTEAETGYYHFYVGLFYPATQGSRGYDLTNGMTFIVGDRITTGRIQSLDGLSFLDLSQNKFNVGDLLTGLDWDVTNAGQLTIRGNIVATNATFVGLIVQNIRTGKVRITADANNIRLVDEVTNKIIMLLDDDSAYEGEYISNSPPIDRPDGSPDPNYLGSTVRQVGGVDVIQYKYVRRGPGGTFGTPGEAATSIGRNGTVTTDINGVIRQRKQVDSLTGHGMVRDDVYNGLLYDQILNKTTNTNQSVEFKLMTLNGVNYVTWDVIPIVEDRMYNPYVVADSGDRNGGTYTPVDPPTEEPEDPEPPTQPTSLRDAGFMFGVVVRKEFLDRQVEVNIALTEAIEITSENECKTSRVFTGMTTTEFTIPDQLVAWAELHDKLFHYHNSWWIGKEPGDFKAYVSDPNTTVQQAKDLLKYMIQTPILRYKGRIHTIDVINEPVKPGSQSWNDSVFIDKIGPVALKLAFVYAHEADPDAILLVNEFSWEYGGNKMTFLLNFINECQNEGIPLHGIGLQMHRLVKNFDNNGVRTQLQRLVNTGMKIRMSEVGLQMRYSPWIQNDDESTFILTDALQEEHGNCMVLLGNAFETIVPDAQKLSFNTWGVIDLNYKNANGEKEYAMMFDNQGNRKKAYTKLLAEKIRLNEYNELPI